MATELPYFRFTASQWLNDDISMEPKEVKGAFIDICAYYWFKDCSITLALLKKRFNYEKEIEILLETNIIKEKKDSDFIEISFLDEQYDLLSKERKKRQKAGKIGGLRRASNAKAKLKQRSSYKDKDKDKDNITKDNNIPFDIFWDLYDKKVGDKLKLKKKWDALNDAEREKIMDHVPRYKDAQPEKKYRKNPETYLNNKSWNDEIIESESNNLFGEYERAPYH